MDINNQIRILGNMLKNRLDPLMIDYALEYIDHSENILSFETLCDHIADYDVKISEDEYRLILALVHDLGLELDSRYLFINPKKH